MSVTTASLALEVPNDRGVVPIVRVLEVSQLYGTRWAAQSDANRWYESMIFAKDGKQPPVLIGRPMPLDRYLYRELIRCSHGDVSERLIRTLDDSSLTRLHLEVHGIA